MKILFITGEFPPMQGGVGDYTREIGLALKDLGCQVHVATSVQAGPVLGPAERPVSGLSVHPVVDRWNWRCWGTIIDLVHQLQPDIVHIQYQAAAYAMHPAINFLPWRLRGPGAVSEPAQGLPRPRTVVTFHDLKVPYLFPKAGPLRDFVIKELARRSDAAITTNREDYEELKEKLAASPSLIPIGSNIAPQLPADYDRDAWRARWGAGSDALLLCFFGFINDRKGVDTLLHALRLLAPDPQGMLNPSLLMIGGQTGASDPTNVAYLAYIRDLITELDLEDRVKWTGYVAAKEVSASFLAADLCVLPFRDGVSFLHGTFHAALAHGLPIVTTEPRVPLPELVDGDNICLVPPEQPQALADAITHLADAPDLRCTLGDGARALSELFRWDRIAADTLELYRTISSCG
jgi:glycosyltransferase involved in cell wall biosynthesis